MTVDVGKLPKLEQHEPLWMRVHRTLEDHIVRHQLLPGAALVEEDLARQLGVSRIPVREGLRVLARDGWVVNRPRIGTTVRQIDLEEAGELFEMRALFEAHTAKQAARRIDDDGLASLGEIIDQEEAAFQSRERDEIVRSNASFHDEVARIAGNRRLREVTGHLAKQLSWLVTAYAGTADAPQLDDHRALLEALAARDARRAESIARHHVQAAWKAYAHRVGGAP